MPIVCTKASLFVTSFTLPKVDAIKALTANVFNETLLVPPVTTSFIVPSVAAPRPFAVALTTVVPI